MKNNTTNVVIISSDDRLHSILSSDTSRHNSNLSFHLENNLGNLLSAPNYDAYIYDVDIAKSDTTSVITTISDLSNTIGKKTLILIGRKETLKVLANSRKLEGVISKTISKPVSFGQIQLAIETYLKKSKVNFDTQQHSTKSSTFSLAKLGVIPIALAAIAIGTYSLLITQDGSTTHSSAFKEISNVSQTSNLKLTEANDVSTKKIDQIHQEALAAINENRLSAPENDNAIYYLKKLVEIDPYDIATNQIRSKLFKRFECIYEDQLVTGDDRELKKTINSILAIEPYNHEYAVRLRELNERVYLAGIARQKNTAQKQNVIATKPSANQEVESNSNDDN